MILYAHAMPSRSSKRHYAKVHIMLSQPMSDRYKAVIPLLIKTHRRHHHKFPSFDKITLIASRPSSTSLNKLANLYKHQDLQLGRQFFFFKKLTFQSFCHASLNAHNSHFWVDAFHSVIFFLTFYNKLFVPLYHGLSRYLPKLDQRLLMSEWCCNPFSSDKIEATIHFREIIAQP
jgi:hypothetical protein